MGKGGRGEPEIKEQKEEAEIRGLVSRHNKCTESRPPPPPSLLSSSLSHQSRSPQAAAARRSEPMPLSANRR